MFIAGIGAASKGIVQMKMAEHYTVSTTAIAIAVLFGLLAFGLKELDVIAWSKGKLKERKDKKKQ